MNDLFVNIKVDREERPDIDAIYMARAARCWASRAAGRSPCSSTADAEPFWGGTYFPQEPRYGRPAFAQVLKRDRAHLSRGAGQGAAERRRAERPARAAMRARRPRPRPRRRGARRSRAAPGPARSIRRMAASGARRNFRSAVLRLAVARAACATACPIRSQAVDAHAHPHLRKAASTIISAAASPATASTSAGSCRISRRCSTTTRCCSS
mgnify:CR=1 FL=1